MEKIPYENKESGVYIPINASALKNGIVLPGDKQHSAVRFSDKIVRRALLMAMEKLKEQKKNT